MDKARGGEGGDKGGRGGGRGDKGGQGGSRGYKGGQGGVGTSKEVVGKITEETSVTGGKPKQATGWKRTERDVLKLLKDPSVLTQPWSGVAVSNYNFKYDGLDDKWYSGRIFLNTKVEAGDSLTQTNGREARFWTFVEEDNGNHPVVNADYIPPHWNETICYVLSAIREVVKKKCKIVDLNKTSKFRDAGQQGSRSSPATSRSVIEENLSWTDFRNIPFDPRSRLGFIDQDELHELCCTSIHSDILTDHWIGGALVCTRMPFERLITDMFDAQLVSGYFISCKPVTAAA
ncbi:hypothetical protein OsJ_31801 [Oryza sativa Japonica Group]|uniref:Glycine-rich RNA binding protein n=2 Tax=Oryza sativa subsp. japonica TaxID=39947 RepID=Q8LNP9_ORYSJ|nr:putative glycine-rich RNA binding protein [Oryza sativa Japonica Group]EAZ16338.1 hypothetical protein OsJ_31801 [Oryza sativa Japonica Group]